MRYVHIDRLCRCMYAVSVIARSPEGTPANVCLADVFMGSCLADEFADLVDVRKLLVFSEISAI